MQLIERQTPPSLVLRAEPCVHDGNTRGPHGMSFHRRRIGDGINLYAEIAGNSLQFVGGHFAYDERAAIEFVAAGFERLFGCFNRDIFQSIAQRR